MKTIHKQTLAIIRTQKIHIPKNSKILSVGNQKENLCIWYACDVRSAELDEIKIRIFGTGHEIENDFDGKFINTVIMHNGDLVWHVFQEI